MKWQFSHPYKDNLILNVGQFTQIIGQNHQLKYYLWQLILWYFDGKKYSYEDLSLFNQVEPEILSDSSEIIKRNSYQIISIADIEDLLDQLSYKKGTVAFEFMRYKFQDLSIISEIDQINDKLDVISNQINKTINLPTNDVIYHVESIYFSPESLLAKQFLPFYENQERNIALEFVDNEIKIILLIEMLAEILESNTNPRLIVFKNLDDFLSYQSFTTISKRLIELTEKYNHLMVLIFPSNEGYLYLTKENMPYINIVSDFTEHLYDFPFMYERFCQQYPSSLAISESEFLERIRKNAAYFFSTDINYVGLSISDLVTITILNKLYFYDKSLSYPIEEINPLEISFLKSKY